MPTAWYKEFFCNTLGVDEELVIYKHDLFANIGSVLMPVNLFYALSECKIKARDKVLIFSVGSVSSASCVILEVGNIGLGPSPTEATEDTIVGGLLALE